VSNNGSSFQAIVSIRLGDGNGDFSGMTDVVGEFSRNLAIGDFNGDGKQDSAYG